MSNIPSAKECAEHGVKEEIKYFVSLLGLGFHPDTDFNDYINNIDNGRHFLKSTAKKLNARLDECHAMCDKYDLDIYGITFEIAKDFQFIHVSPILHS